MATTTKTLEPGRWVREREAVVADYRTAYRSRLASIIGRKEVLTGKAKFGIFGDGKEVPQLAMARAFAKGDFRSGYYRDQTFMFATGLLTLEQFFSQVYADDDPDNEPMSGGRMMNAHFASRLLERDGAWTRHTEAYNTAADLSPTASQMPRLVGLSYASKLYRELDELRMFTQFSLRGNEVVFGTIGNASCAEGMFWETVNAVGVLQGPLVLSIWDDGYGISVPNELQIAKADLSAVLSGFQRNKGQRAGFDLYRVAGWDYPALCETYAKAAAVARSEHVPAIIHVIEVTQPQGHSTSGSHERYKSKERLQWEASYCCNQRMRGWMEQSGIAKEKELEQHEEEDAELVRKAQQRAWDACRAPIEKERTTFIALAQSIAAASSMSGTIKEIVRSVEGPRTIMRRDLVRAATDVLVAVAAESSAPRSELSRWREAQLERGRETYGTHLHSSSAQAALKAARVDPAYSEGSPTLAGFEVLNRCFDANLARDPAVVAFGEDLGQLGDVNQAFLGLQAKYGPLRVSDTGIRECTILGQAIGLAMRGLRPIAEIQYLDYVLYVLQQMSDDLATLRWRSFGGQKAPVIVRTRGHRLEGVWHSGSPMAGIINLVRGVYVCVPRDMTRAAGFYNLLLRSDDPALVIEPLNAYRIKERLPDNVGEMTVPLGVPEVLREGKDVTVVTYGPLCRIVLEAAELLASRGIDLEVLDVQTLLPFDLQHVIAASVRKTSRVVFVDEDVPGGVTAYMMQKVLEEQGAFAWLDSPPRAVSAKEHRPAYGSDGDYFSKPNREEIFAAVYELMHEAAPGRFPLFYR